MSTKPVSSSLNLHRSLQIVVCGARPKAGVIATFLTPLSQRILEVSSPEEIPQDPRYAYFVEKSLVSEWEKCLDPSQTDPLVRTICFAHESLSAEKKVALYEKGVSIVVDAASSEEWFLARMHQWTAHQEQRLAQSRITRRLNQRVHQVRQSLHNQKDLLNMAVHDLRSPLAAMVCYAELLMEGVLGNLKKTQLEPIRTIHRNCQFLIDMVNDVLESARVDAGVQKLALEKVDFAREAELVVQSLRGLAEAKSIVVRLGLEPIPPLFADPSKLSRILSNLLGNAIRFTKNRGEILIRATQRENHLIFSIQDTGPGIPGDQLENIFAKFQIGAESALVGKGHGLGLTITKTFIELHGGRIFVESVRNKGSTFIFHLPIEKRRHSLSLERRKRIAVVDLAKDLPILREWLQDGKTPFDLITCSPEDDFLGFESGQEPDVILVNELSSYPISSLDFYALSARGDDWLPCISLVPQGMELEQRQFRENMGIRLLEKPCTGEELGRKLLETAGLDRRKAI